MSNVFQIIFLCIMALAMSFLISFILQKFLINFCKGNGIMDYSSERKLDKNPRPRLGGVGIFFSFFATLYLIVFLVDMVGTISLGYVFDSNLNRLFIYVGSAAFIFLVGAVDDFKPIHYRYKLLTEVGVASILFFSGFQIKTVTIPFFGASSLDLGGFAYPVTILWIVGVINAMNLIDGIDGLAGGITAIASIAMIVIFAFSSRCLYSFVLLPFLGATLGFMSFNRYPSKIFMGDSGSLFSGLILSTLAIKTGSKASMGIVLLAPLAILALPVIDTSLAFLRRLVKGKNPFSPDMDHIHHRLLKRGFSEKRVANLLLSISAIFSALGIALYFTDSNLRMIILLTLFVFMFVVLVYLDTANIKLFLTNGKRKEYLRSLERKTPGRVHE